MASSSGIIYVPCRLMNEKYPVSSTFPEFFLVTFPSGLLTFLHVFYYQELELLKSNVI
jgi:hypothetical protein